MTLNQTIAPVGEPLDLPEIKQHLRIDGTEEDALVQSYMIAARNHIEQHAGLSFLTQSHLWLTEETSARLYFPRGPVSHVSLIECQTPSGDWQEIESEDYSFFAGVQAYLVFQTPLQDATRIRINFTSGYLTTEDIPQALLQALTILTAHFYEQRTIISERRQFSTPDSVQALLAPYAQVRL